MRNAVAGKTSHPPPLRQLDGLWFNPATNPIHLGPAKQVPDQCDHEQDQENEEQDFRDAGCRYGYAGEAQQSCYQCNDEKSQCPTQHRNLLTVDT
jgi:hypothetical protein